MRRRATIRATWQEDSVDPDSDALVYATELDEDLDLLDRACLRDPPRRRRFLQGLSAGAVVEDRSWAPGPIWIQGRVMYQDWELWDLTKRTWRIRDLLKDGCFYTPRQVSEGLHISTDMSVRTLEQMRLKGELERSHTGAYRLIGGHHARERLRAVPPSEQPPWPSMVERSDEDRRALIYNEIPERWVSLAHLEHAFKLIYHRFALPSIALVCDLETLIDLDLVESRPGLIYRRSPS